MRTSGYTWEQDLSRPWESVSSSVTTEIQKTVDASRRNRNAALQRLLSFLDSPSAGDGRCVRRGVIRFVYVVLDLSGSVTGTGDDLVLPCIEALHIFFHQFFDRNPLGHVGLIVARDGRAKVLAFASSSRAVLLEVIRGATVGVTSSGTPSLQNALDLAIDELQDVPSFASREILIVWRSLRTVDGGNIFTTFAKIATAGIRVNIVGIGASMRLFERLASITRARYVVSTPQRPDLTGAVLVFSRPLAVTDCDTTPALIKATFPSIARGIAAQSICSCHRHVVTGGFDCGHCSLRVCELPALCAGCGGLLVAPPALARAAGSLTRNRAFPSVALLRTLQLPDAGDAGGASSELALGSGDADSAPILVESVPSMCAGCAMPFDRSATPAAVVVGFLCSRCGSVFCEGCDVLINTVLLGCPDCLEKL